jgi:5-methylcytosine-specific restriction endonuclease McrA
MAGKPQPPKQTCKRGHALTQDNLLPSALRLGMRRCKVCALAYQSTRKQAAKREARGYEVGEKPTCVNGHARTSENLRPGRTDCAVCHREQAMAKARQDGVQPAKRLSRMEKLAQRRKWEATRKARKLAAFVEQVDPILVYERDGGVCGICEEAVEFTGFEVDHVIPLARGGEHSYRNVQTAHPTCNRRKWANYVEAPSRENNAVA